MPISRLLLTSTSAWPPWLTTVGGLALGLAHLRCLVRRAHSGALHAAPRLVERHAVLLCQHGPRLGLVENAAAGSCSAARRSPSSGAAAGSRGRRCSRRSSASAFGGGLVWAVRIARADRAAQRSDGLWRCHADGDDRRVSRLAACLMIFFLSPFAALVIAVAQCVADRAPRYPLWTLSCALPPSSSIVSLAVVLAELRRAISPWLAGAGDSCRRASC